MKPPLPPTAANPRQPIIKNEVDPEIIHVKTPAEFKRIVQLLTGCPDPPPPSLPSEESHLNLDHAHRSSSHCPLGILSPTPTSLPLVSSSAFTPPSPDPLDAFLLSPPPPPDPLDSFLLTPPPPPDPLDAFLLTPPQPPDPLDAFLLTPPQPPDPLDAFLLTPPQPPDPLDALVLTPPPPPDPLGALVQTPPPSEEISIYDYDWEDPSYPIAIPIPIPPANSKNIPLSSYRSPYYPFNFPYPFN